MLNSDAPRSTRRVDRFLWRMTVVCVVLILACGGLTTALFAVVQANHASGQAQAACQLYHDVANSPIPPKGTTTLGLHISAGARTAYVRANCHLGQLNKPDPRILPFLPVELR